MLKGCDIGRIKRPAAIPEHKKRVKPVVDWRPRDTGVDRVRQQIAETLEKRFKLDRRSLDAEAPVTLSVSEARLAELRKELRLIERITSEVARDSLINQPEIIDRLRPLADLGSRVAHFGEQFPAHELVNQIESLRGLIEHSALADVDPDSSEPIREQLRAREGLGNIKMSLDRALKVGRSMGFEAGQPAEDADRLRSTPRASIGDNTIRELGEKLDRVEQQLSEFSQRASSELPAAEIPREMADSFAGRMAVKVDLARLELANDNTIDLAVVRQGVEEMADLSASFAENAERLPDRLSSGLRWIVRSIRELAAGAAQSVRQVVSRLLRNRPPSIGHPGQLGPGELLQDCWEQAGQRLCGPQLVVMPKGEFMMGSAPGTGADDERPQHKITIDYALAVATAPVTRGEFAGFVEATKRDMNGGAYGWTGSKWEHEAKLSWRNPGFAQDDNHPVVCVHWQDAVAYAKWLEEQTGKPYRLLTEAEWEYCCRAGIVTAYSVGETITREQANFGRNEKGTTPVRKYAPNAWGLSDMHGNVSEWCQDNWHPNYNGAPADGSVWQGGDSSLRVLRGGSWYGNPQDLRSANRYRYLPDNRNSGIGFRLARTLLPL